ncbi:MAG TPA: TCR/Tet family MFS transporter [Caulobacteraceae bacterium]|jgi:DHA1 family tetracycline resistance protein-like MFS transporter|nr:TCR/Tet family MFS transporter [Caulobacteraceae bacterium]
MDDRLQPPEGGDQVTELGGRRRAAVGFVFAVAVMDVLATGLVIPVLPQLVKAFNHGDTAAAARYFGAFGLIFGVMQFFASPVLGALSDRFGRRPVILTSIIGLGLDYFLMALSPTIGWLFVGRMISGVTAATFSTAAAYVADITPPDKRAKAFGLMGSAFGIGFTIGPTLGGFLGGIDLRLPFWVAGGLALVNGLYGLFVLPESLPVSRRAPFVLKKANPIGSFELLRSQPDLLGLAAIIFLYFLAHQVLQSSMALYTNYRYGWGPQMLGLNLLGVGVGNILVQAFVVGPFVARFGERGALYTGLTAGAIGFLIYGTATTSLQFWLGLPIFSLMGLTQPGYQGMMSRRVGPTQQGRLQGANAGLMALAGIIGPVLFTQVFAWSITPPGHGLGDGTTLFMSVAMMATGLVLALSQARPRRAVAAPGS